MSSLRAAHYAPSTLRRALQLVRDDALVFADHEGRHLHPEHFSWSFVAAIKRCNAETGVDLPVIRFTTCAIRTGRSLLTAGRPVKVVSERLGHASPVITMSVYAHVLPGGQRAAAEAFDKLIGGGAS